MTGLPAQHDGTSAEGPPGTAAPRYAASRYNVLVPLRDGRTLAYNSMSGATAVWERNETAAFRRIADDGLTGDVPATVADLVYGGFIVAGGVDELALLKRQYDAARTERSAMVLTIAPTLMCNFGCDYCFQGADKPAGQMSPTVQDEVVRFVTQASTSLTRLHVAWYGGEPLLAPKVIESLSGRLIAACAEHSVAYDAMIVTNGFKLTAAVARALVARRVKSAQVTLDGAMADHDGRRYQLGGQGSFDRIVANMRAVVEEEVPLHLSVRVNIDARNAASIEDLLAVLVSLGFAGRKNFGVYFAPVEAITEGCHNVAADCMSKPAYAELETTLARRAFDAGLAALPYPSRFRGICGAVRPRGWVVLPNGDIHKCWDTVADAAQRVGSIFDIASLESDERVSRWNRWSPFDEALCRDCVILPNCAGSCAHKFLNPGQTLGEAAALPCPSWKFNLHERLLLRAEKSGAISAGDYEPAAVRTPLPARYLASCAASGAVTAGPGRPVDAGARTLLPVLAGASTPARTGAGGR